MSQKPLMVAALGGRGTGKSAWVQREVRRIKPARLAVWDMMDEHQWTGQSTKDLAAAIRAMKAPRFAVRFVPSADDKQRARQFDLFCLACMAAGRLLLYVEELAFVTSSHKAPAGWRRVCLLGRHDRHRVSVIATSQRPAQVDKEFMGNLDRIHCGRLASRGDAETAAQLLGVDRTEVLRMADLAWIERDAGDTEPRRGVLTFGNEKKPAVKRGAADAP